MSETFNNHEEKTGEGWESLMASLAEEAGKFDPKKAMEAREQRKANRIGGAHLKPEDRIDFEAELENLGDRTYREKTNVPTMELFMKRMGVIEKQFPILSDETWRSQSSGDGRELWHQVVSEVPESVWREHSLLKVANMGLAKGILAEQGPIKMEAEGVGSMIVANQEEEDIAKQTMRQLEELHEKNSGIVDFNHEQDVDIKERLDYNEYLPLFNEMQRRKVIADGGGLHLKPEGLGGTRTERTGGAHLKPESVEGEVRNTEEKWSRPEEESKVDSEAEAVTEAKVESEIDSKMETDADIYDREYREQVNVPISDLFTKRRVVIEEQYPALKPLLSGEETRRYFNDKEYRAKRDQMLSEVPREVAEEHDLLGLMVGRLDDGIRAGVRSDSSLAGSEPNYVPVELNEEGYGTVVTTQWKAEHVKQDLARLRELHEKNSEIIDFSHEQEVDIDSLPDGVQQGVDDLAGEIEALRTAEYRDFQSSGDERPRAAAIFDKITNLSKIGNLSYATRQMLSQKKYELRKAYMEARDAAEIRDIDMRIGKLQKEKAEIEARQKKYADAGFVAKMFGRLFDPNRAEREEEQLGSIDRHLKKLDERTQRLRKVVGNE